MPQGSLPMRGAAARDQVRRLAASPICRVVLRRLALAVPLLLIVSALSFVLVSAQPSNAARSILGTGATASAVRTLEARLGLNQPVYEQYWHWLTKALSGNLGASYLSSQSVGEALRQRYPVTLSLVLVSLIVFVVVGTLLGVLGAVWRGPFGRIVDGASLVGFAIPPFWLGTVLVVLFAAKLRWFPAIGYVSPGTSVGDWARSLVLPVAALATTSVALLAKQTREAMLDVLAGEHIRMARANGIPPRTIIFRLALKNAAARIVTISGLQVITLLSGTIFIEYVFSLPGLGSGLVSAASQGDLPVAQAITVIFTLTIVVINLIVDVLYTLLDPRVRTS